jgi:hypothetical protein
MQARSFKSCAARPTPWTYAVLIVLMAVFGCSLLFASAAMAANFTWSGEGSASANTWSNGTNWIGGMAPATSSTVGTLTFPALTSSACSAAPPTAACYATNNDVSGLVIEHLQLSNPATEPYVVSGAGITLGSGGLSASPPSSQNVGNVSLLLPITLGNSQAWNLTGPAGGGGSAGGGNVTAEGLTGSSANLTVNLEDGSGLYLKGDNEVGDVTVNGMNGTTGSINLYGEPSHVYRLDASDGHTLTVNNGVDFLAVNAAVGGYDSVGAVTNVGRPFGIDPGTLSTTSVQLDAKSTLALEIAEPGSTVGIDYGQLTSTGEVALNGATLSLSETLPSGKCPALSVGQEYTLISTVGSLSGTFGNAPNGGIVSDEGFCHNTYRINYNTSSSPRTVTATVTSSGGVSTPANFTWSGGGTANEWSNAANWEGGTAPSGKLATLAFPVLTSPACTANPATATCYESNNDVNGLEVSALSISGGYSITGNSITLGSGGITASAGASTPPNRASIVTPITLSAPQTWSIDGSHYAGLYVGSKVTGSSNALAISLPNQGSLELAGDVEAGTVTVTGGYRVTLSGGGSETGQLNATDGNPVNFGAGIELIADHGATGPLTLTGAGLYLSNLGDLSSAGGLSVAGGVTLGNTFTTEIVKSGTVAGSDYGQLTATGPVNLDSAQLTLFTSKITEAGFRCLELTPGVVYTLATTTGTLSGTFNGVPNGATVSGNCGLGVGTAPTLKFNYTAHAVTATVLTAGSGESEEETAATKKQEEEAAAKKHQEEVSTKGGSSSTGNSGPTPSTVGSPPATVSSAQIAALLGQQLIPSGKAAKIGALLKSGGLKMSFQALEAGTLSVQWYEVPAGAKLAKHSKVKPVLVASGQLTFSAAGTKTLRIRLTAAGRKLLRHTKSLRLTVKGMFTVTGQAGVGQTVSFALRH